MRGFICFVASIVSTAALAQQNWVIPETPPELPAGASSVEFSGGNFLMTADDALLQSFDGRSDWLSYTVEDMRVLGGGVHDGDLYLIGYLREATGDPVKRQLRVLKYAGDEATLVYTDEDPQFVAEGESFEAQIEEVRGKPTAILIQSAQTRFINLLPNGEFERFISPGAATTYTPIPDGVLVVHEPSGMIAGGKSTPVLTLTYYPADLIPTPEDSTKATTIGGDLLLIGVTDRFTAIAYGDGRCVGLGPAGKVLLSEDLQRWSVVEVEGLPALADITFGAGYFVAVGEGGAAYYSTDGLEWEATQLPTEEDLTSVTYGNDHFVALIGSGELAYAMGGIWSSEPLIDAYEVSSPWLGHFWTLPNEDWIYHANHGWLFTFAQEDALLLHDASVGGWLWTSSELYPYVYSFSEEHPGWLYYYPATNRWYYSFDLQDYFHAAPN